MTRIKLDAELRGKLRNLAEPLELCDETGRVVGRVFPSTDASDYEPTEPQADEEELRRREQSSGRRDSTAEVIGHLERR
jgi:hypothetical protein